MSLPEIVPHNRAAVRMVISSPLRHQCPFVDEVDQGAIALTWTTDGGTIELHSLRKYLDGFRDRRISHEELTGLIRGEVRGLDGIKDITVETTWNTAGMGVRCSTSLTLALPQ